MRARRRPLPAILAALAALTTIPSDATASTHTVRVGGTGMALAALSLLAAKQAAGPGGIDVAVLPSLGTTGGIRAVIEREIDIAVTARRLKPEEIAKGLRESACFDTPIVFATSHPRPQQLTLASLPKIYASGRPTWPDGTPIKVIMRSPSGSENPYLASKVPGIAEAFETALRQPGMVVGATDQENAELALRAAGSLAVASLLQIRSEQLKLAPIALDGVEPSLASVTSGAYPLKTEICLVSAHPPKQDVARFLDYARSAEGRGLIKSLGARFVD